MPSYLRCAGLVKDILRKLGAPEFYIAQPCYPYPIFGWLAALNWTIMNKLLEKGIFFQKKNIYFLKDMIWTKNQNLPQLQGELGKEPQKKIKIINNN